MPLVKEVLGFVSAFSRRERKAFSIFNAPASSFKISPGRGLFRPLVDVAGISDSRADLWFPEEVMVVVGRRIDAFSAAISFSRSAVLDLR